MTSSELTRTAARRALPASPPPATAAAVGLTVYGCDEDEADLFRDLAPRFGVVPTLTEDAVCEANVGLAAGSRCVSVGHKSHVTRDTLRALSRAGVRYLCTRSIGYDHIDVEHARRLGICVENVAYSPHGVADYTLMLMLMALRHAQAMVRRVDRHDYRSEGLRGKELRDLTVGVIGAGRIGAAVACRLRGFGCRVLAFDEHATASADHVGLEQLLQHSDVVTLHAPLTEATHHLLDARRLARMKRGAIVVNTARGALLDTGALIRALESGALGAAALDVVEREQGTFYADCSERTIEDESLRRLQALPNVILSPHIAYYTDRALRDIVEGTITNCLKHERRAH